MPNRFLNVLVGVAVLGATALPVLAQGREHGGELRGHEGAGIHMNVGPMRGGIGFSGGRIEHGGWGHWFHGAAVCVPYDPREPYWCYDDYPY